MLVLLFVTAAYVALPWWLPEAWLRSWLAERMSRQMGVPVEIDAAGVSWDRGLRLEGLRIYSPERFGREPMVEISSVAMDFSPLRALMTKTIDWMEIEQPRVHVRIDARGEVNLAPLQLLQFDFEAERITVRRALGVVQLPEAPSPLQVEVHDMQLLRGQATRFGRITFSGGIEQQPSQAPLSGQVSISQAGTSATASMAFSFSDVRLDQLLLRQLLGLPLRRLTGRASGSLDLHLNREGIIDQFSLDVGIRRLDAQPLEGPGLPVIDQAGLELSASYDPLTQIVDVGRLRLRLPGIDLDGSGQVYDEFALGNWQALESLQLAGTVRPSQVLALLTGRTELAGDLRVDGPIQVRLQLDHPASTQLDLAAEIDATDAGILRGTDVLKPPGRTLQAALAGRIDDRVWRLDVQQSRLQLGENTVTGTGSLADLRDLLGADPAGPGRLTERVIELAGQARWQGSARLGDLADLADLDPQLVALLGPIRQAGPVAAEMSFNGPAGNRFAVLLDIPAETRFRYGRHLAQQSDQDLQLALSGRVDPAAARMVDGSLTVNLNQQPALRVSRLDLLYRGGDHCAGSGRVWLDQIGQLCRLLPAHHQRLRGLSGSGWMEFRFGCRQGRFGLDLSADLSAMEVDRPGLWNKPARSRRDVDRVELSVRRDGTDRLFEIEGLARTRRGELTFSGALPRLDRIPRAGRLGLSLRLADVAELSRAFPALPNRLGGVQLSGPVQARTDLDFHPDRAEWACQVTSPGLALALPVEPARSIRAALGAELRGMLRPGPDSWQLTVGESRVRIGEDLAEASLAGTLALPTDRSVLARPAAWLGKLTGRTRAEVTINLDRLDPAVAGPLLARPEAPDLTGRLTAALDLHLEPDRAGLGLDILADKLRMGPTPLEKLFGPDRVDPRLGRLVLAKPADLAARLSLQAHVRLSDGAVTLEEGSGRIGPLSVSMRRARDGKQTTKLALWTDRAEDLPRLLPALAEAKPSGTAWLRVELSEAPGRIESVHVRTKELRAKLAGETLRLDGELRARGLSLAGRTDQWTVSQVHTDGLRIGIGQSHGWLLARAEKLPEAPTGRVELLAGKLDDRALLAWAQRLTETAAEPSTSTTGRPEAMDQANRQVAMLRRLAARANLTVRVHCREYVNFDPRVEQTYHLAELELRAALREGEASIAYDAALSGGKYIGAHEIDLTASEPIIRNRVRMRDVIATENIQPQLAIYFPGNTVLGYFNRDETTRTALAQTLAGLQDVRWRPSPIGTAVTMTTDGYVVGQAAPGFVTGIFPGLNLARYRYQKMTGFTDFRPDGTAGNDMIFDGQDYDVYMEGTTDQANRVDYEVGLLVLGGQSPEWHHAWRQGRLPVLKVSGRIHNGQLRDQQVSFPWPNETIGAIFVRNSIFYRMWVNWRGETESSP